MKKLILIIAIVFSGMLVQAQEFTETFDYVDFWDVTTGKWKGAKQNQGIEIVFNYKDESGVIKMYTNTEFTLHLTSKHKVNRGQAYFFVDNEGGEGVIIWKPYAGVLLVFWDKIDIRYVQTEKYDLYMATADSY